MTKEENSMSDENDPLSAERAFFAALLAGSEADLKAILADDFVLVDVMSGSEISKLELLTVVGMGQLRFTKIDVHESRVRRYPPGTAVVNGRTEMAGWFGESAFSAHSRYTHVYVRMDGRWRLVAAQGTPIAAAPAIDGPH